MKTVAVLLALVLMLNLSGVAVTSRESQTAKVKDQIEKRYATSHANITLTTNAGKKFKGRILGVNQDSFDFHDGSIGSTSTIAFSDIEKVSGARMSKGAKIGLWAGIGFVLLWLLQGATSGGNNCPPRH
jgi:hypothetical protein